MNAKPRTTEAVARALRVSIGHGERIQKELARFEQQYPSYTRAHELLRQCLAENLERTRQLEAELEKMRGA